MLNKVHEEVKRKILERLEAEKLNVIDFIKNQTEKRLSYIIRPIVQEYGEDIVMYVMKEMKQGPSKQKGMHHG